MQCHAYYKKEKEKLKQLKITSTVWLKCEEFTNLDDISPFLA
jgi:hypothetical protein